MVPILYEDNHLLIINKPAGMLSQGDGKRESLVDVLSEYIRVSAKKTGNVYIGGVHRLDAPVSGAMVFAKTSKAASRLSLMMKTNSIVKLYFALSYCNCDIPVSAQWVHFRGSCVRPHDVTRVFHDMRGDTAIEHYYRHLEVRDGQILTAVQLISGKKHQIRAFLKSLGMPVHGDSAYGANRLAENNRAILLHAGFLSFVHPVKKIPMSFRAPFPSYFPAWVNDDKYFGTVE